MTEPRRQVVSYLPPISNYQPSLFIKRQLPEAFQWEMFVKLFSTELWLMESMFALVIATWLFLSNGGSDSDSKLKVSV